MKTSRGHAFVLLWMSFSLSACSSSKEQPRPQKARHVTVATVQSQSVTLTKQYVGQIKSHRHIEVRTPTSGILEAISIKEGQAVHQYDVLFQVRPIPGIGNEPDDLERDDKLVSILAAFDGVVGRMPDPQDGLVRRGEALTTLSDNSSIWVYFNVPEHSYLEHHADNQDEGQDDLTIELVLADGTKFDQPGTLGAIGAVAHSEIGAITFRADFPNPDGRLMPGMSGIVSISRVQNDALVIPQRATLEHREKRYVYVVDKEDVVHERKIVVQNELDDVYVVKAGLAADEMIVLVGVRQVRDGDPVEYDNLPSKKMFANRK